MRWYDLPIVHLSFRGSTVYTSRVQQHDRYDTAHTRDIVETARYRTVTSEDTRCFISVFIFGKLSGARQFVDRVIKYPALIQCPRETWQLLAFYLCTPGRARYTQEPNQVNRVECASRERPDSVRCLALGPVEHHSRSLLPHVLIRLPLNA